MSVKKRTKEELAYLGKKAQATGKAWEDTVQAALTAWGYYVIQLYPRRLANGKFVEGAAGDFVVCDDGSFILIECKSTNLSHPTVDAAARHAVSMLEPHQFVALALALRANAKCRIYYRSHSHCLVLAVGAIEGNVIKCCAYPINPVTIWTDEDKFVNTTITSRPPRKPTRRKVKP